jgi:glucosamine--fructose-6-phosphate aminotransferase (isomerizing)
MLKEIYEQPGVVRTCARNLHRHHLDRQQSRPHPVWNCPMTCSNKLEHIQVVACGTSWHASLVGKYLLEQLAGMPTMVQYASEFRYSPSP